jgi:hypothetical protein
MNSIICMILAVLGMLAPVAAQQRLKSATANDTEQILAAEHAWAQDAVKADTAHPSCPTIIWNSP